MKLLLIGSGGREHALAWKLAQSEKIEHIYVAPGNGGTATSPKCSNIEDTNYLKFAQDKSIDLIVVGPEIPLAEGIVDAFQAKGFKIWGPSKAAAQLEASKAFSKDFMQRHNIPTANFESFSDYDEALVYLEKQEGQVVIKASGLAAGKGVILPENIDEARAALKELMLDKVFASAGETVVIEERLEGPELSIFAFSDGTNIQLMPACQDHKRALDGDRGLNTGGMGAYAPAPLATQEIIDEVRDTIILPTINGLRAEGTPYVGVLYTGVMLTANGVKTIEFNCRFGDPETEVLMPLLDSDLVDILLASVEGTLDKQSISWKDQAAVTVVLASGGYPQTYEKGKTIKGLDKTASLVFHAGTKLAKLDSDTDTYVTAGGRVLNVIGLGQNIADAVDDAYKGVTTIEFDGMHYRKDIAFQALEQNKQKNNQKDNL